MIFNLKISCNKNEFVKKMISNISENEIYKIEIEDMIKQCTPLINPVGYVVVEKEKGDYVLNCLVTLGYKIDKQKDKYFAENDLLKGYFIDCLCDEILFNATTELYDEIKKYCDEEKINLSVRNELCDENIVLQKEILQKINEVYDTNVDITTGYMLTPLKTLSYFYTASKNHKENHFDQTCDNCKIVNCHMKKHNVLVKNGDDITILKVTQNENLLKVLQKNNFNILANCGGVKKCGKCKVKIKSENKENITETEKKLLSEKEIKNDVRLSCFYTVNKDIEVEILNKEDSFIEFNFNEKFLDLVKKEGTGFDFCIDIGTTTIVNALVDKKNNEIVYVDRFTNVQSNVGSDVISRIKHYNENENNTLSYTLREQIANSIKKVINEKNIDESYINNIILSGNTLMSYFVLDKNPEALGKAPYYVDKLNMINMNSNSVLGDFNKNLIIMPWISAFVGGDIVSSIYFTNLHKENKNILLIDIGTNGEVVLKTKNKVVATSAPAGSAFEGVGIKHGSAGINGAINSFADIDEFSTIGNAEAKSICGSGLIDVCAYLIKRKLMSQTGALHKPFKVAEDLYIYPEDVRQLQLAKGAIFACVSTLIYNCGLSANEIEKVYLCGGFGSNINVENALAISLIPKELKGKVESIGNTSLGGSVKFAINPDKNSINKIVEDTEHIELFSNAKFNEFFMDGMMF